MTVNLLSQGASITGMTVHLAGSSRDVVLGYAQAEDYASDPFYMGATTENFQSQASHSPLTLMKWPAPTYFTEEPAGCTSKPLNRHIAVMILRLRCL